MILALLAAAALPEMSRADWLKPPTQAEVSRAYPQKAAQDQIQGHATLRCAVDAAGLAHDCQTLEETPRAYGLGAAAIALLDKRQMRPFVVDGRPTEAMIDIGVRFARPPEPPLPSLDQTEVCVGYGRSRLEKDPSLDSARTDLNFWSSLMDMRASLAAVRPSLLKAEVAAAEKMATTLLTSGDTSGIDRCKQGLLRTEAAINAFKIEWETAPAKGFFDVPASQPSPSSPEATTKGAPQPHP